MTTAPEPVECPCPSCTWIRDHGYAPDDPRPDSMSIRVDDDPPPGDTPAGEFIMSGSVREILEHLNQIPAQRPEPDPPDDDR